MEGGRVLLTINERAGERSVLISLRCSTDILQSRDRREE